ncbi:MAG: DUF4179 domain-containing protein [Eubacteriaceae bacterium]
MMEKKYFQDEMDKIEVPMDKVKKAIDDGIPSETIPIKKRRNIRRIAISSVAAMVIMFFSLFVFVPAHVIANVPIIGGLYEKFDYPDIIGEDLESKELITRLNETCTFEGIEVTMTSVYYDGASIGGTFDVVGDVEKKYDDYETPSVLYELYNGEELGSEGLERARLKNTENGYTGMFQTIYPNETLPEDATLTIELKEVGKTEGSWNFNIPISQLSNEVEKYDIKIYNKEADVNITFDSIVYGESSTVIDYTLDYPKELISSVIDTWDFKDMSPVGVIWDWNKDLGTKTSMYFETKKDGERYQLKNRMIYTKVLKDEMDQLELTGYLNLIGTTEFISLDEKMPRDVEVACRPDLKITIERMFVEDNKLMVDYKLFGDKNDEEFINNSTRYRVQLKEESKKEIEEVPVKEKTEEDNKKEVNEIAIDHETIVLDKDEMRYRSVYDITKLEGFDINNNKYVLVVKTGPASVELDPVSIDLTK